MLKSARSIRHKLETQGLQPQKDVGVKQWPWMDE
jgi:hypothetical protein